MTIDVLLLGGRGRIGSGLRMYLPRLDPAYRLTSVDLPGCEDQATEPVPRRDFVDLDIAAEPGRVRELMAGRDLVVYLARQGSLAEMNAMTDLVFKAVLAQDPVPMVIGASSVHACDGAYSVDEGPWSIWAERRFDELDPPPERVSSLIDACPTNDYGREKAHVEQWCERLAALGHGAVAARWGGINPANAMTAGEGLLRPLVPPGGRGAVRPLHAARRTATEPCAAAPTTSWSRTTPATSSTSTSPAARSAIGPCTMPSNSTLRRGVRGGNRPIDDFGIPPYTLNSHEQQSNQNWR